MNNLRLGFAAASVLFATAALAQAPVQSSGMKPPANSTGNVQFSAIDKNSDGRVSRAEAQAYSDLTTSFTTLDADSDTYLSQLEFGKWKSNPPPATTAPGSSTQPRQNNTPQTGQPPVPSTTSPNTSTAPTTVAPQSGGAGGAR